MTTGTWAGRLSAVAASLRTAFPSVRTSSNFGGPEAGAGSRGGQVLARTQFNGSKQRKALDDAMEYLHQAHQFVRRVAISGCHNPIAGRSVASSIAEAPNAESIFSGEWIAFLSIVAAREASRGAANR